MSYSDSTSQATPVPEHCLPVLVIDDNPADRRLATLELGAVWPFDRDLKVDCAETGEQALEKIHTGQFKLIVLDWNLPRMSGGDVLRILYNHGIAAPVIVLSGLTRDELNEDIEALGATFLNKDDMTPTTLSKAVATAIALRRRCKSPLAPAPVAQPLGQNRLPPAA